MHIEVILYFIILLLLFYRSNLKAVTALALLFNSFPTLLCICLSASGKGPESLNLPGLSNLSVRFHGLSLF